MLIRYEIVVIVKSGISADGEKKIFDQLKLQMGESGKLSAKKDLGKKILKYPIKKETEGNYYLFDVETNGSNIKKISKYLSSEEMILRHLVIAKE